MIAEDPILTAELQRQFPAPEAPSPTDSLLDVPASDGYPNPVPISQLGSADAVKWVWTGYLARMHTTLFTGLWKAGKTTLLAWLLKVFATGGNLGGVVQQAKVLVISEESKALWSRRREDLGLGDHVHIIARPFLGRPSAPQWQGFINHLARLVRMVGYDVVVFDTLGAFWPVSDENDAAKVQTALMLLNALTEAGAAVLLNHHPRKGDGNEGQASRGSGALPGFVDIILELRRYEPENRDDRRRALTCYSRFDESPAEVVLELTEAGYVSCGSKADAKQADRLGLLEEILPADGPGLTADEVWARWPEGSIPRPAKRTVRYDLQEGAWQAWIPRAGSDCSFTHIAKTESPAICVTTPS